MDEVNDKDFRFKCHRSNENKNMLTADVFSINSIAFNKKYNTFCTAGADGHFVVWNYQE